MLGLSWIDIPESVEIIESELEIGSDPLVLNFGNESKLRRMSMESLLYGRCPRA
jgi:hypothetical protein